MGRGPARILKNQETLNMSFAFVFPGQGSQSVGMMAAYGDAAVVRATFDEASAALGDDLWAMVADGPAELLTQTVNTQPVMLTAGIAAWRLWQEKGGKKPATNLLLYSLNFLKTEHPRERYLPIHLILPLQNFDYT